MKIYQLRTISNPQYAHIHAQMGQNIDNGGKLQVCWDNYLAKGNNISDWCYSSYLICVRHVAELLMDKFSGLSLAELEWRKNPIEECAKNVKRLKWLPKEPVDMVHIFSTKEVLPLKESTIEYGTSVINGRPCIQQIHGGAEWSLVTKSITPRNRNMGLFISEKDIVDSDFFRPANTPILLCKEYVKSELEQIGYKNLIFLEVGEIIS